MKKLFALLLAVVMVLGLVACGEKEAAPATTEAPAATDAATPDATEGVEATEPAVEAK